MKGIFWYHTYIIYRSLQRVKYNQDNISSQNDVGQIARLNIIYNPLKNLDV